MVIVTRPQDPRLLEAVIEYIRTEKPNAASIEAQTSLIEEGILDSMFLLKLVDFLQERFAVAIESEEITPENFETVEGIERLVARKRSGSGSS
jgi:acyl carrier protein